MFESKQLKISTNYRMANQKNASQAVSQNLIFTPKNLFFCVKTIYSK